MRFVGLVLEVWVCSFVRFELCSTGILIWELKCWSSKKQNQIYTRHFSERENFRRVPFWSAEFKPNWVCQSVFLATKQPYERLFKVGVVKLEVFVSQGQFRFERAPAAPALGRNGKWRNVYPELRKSLAHMLTTSVFLLLENPYVWKFFRAFSFFIR